MAHWTCSASSDTDSYAALASDSISRFTRSDTSIRQVEAPAAMKLKGSPLPLRTTFASAARPASVPHDVRHSRTTFLMTHVVIERCP